MRKCVNTKGVVGVGLILVLIILFWTKTEDIGIYRNFFGSKQDPSESPEILKESPEMLKETQEILKETPEVSEESPEISGESPVFVLYNRVPKCGSSFFGAVLNPLCSKNGFQRIDTKKTPDFFPSGKSLMSQTNQELLETKTKILDLHQKTLYVEHTHFVNISSPKVAYINLIRDPLKRVNSVYCYARDLTKKFGQKQLQLQAQKTNDTLSKNWLSTPLGQCIRDSSISHCVTSYNLFITIKYFCGTHHTCYSPNTDAAVDQAIANIDQFYSVVGVLEDIDKTLAVMEEKLPGYFRGAGKSYEELVRQGIHVRNKCKADLKPLQDTKDPEYKLLREYLKREYRIYDYVRDKLEQQYSNIKKVRL